jgi:predicted amidohydrolase YtcJ
MDITESALIEVEPARVDEALFQLLVPEALRLATQNPELQQASRIAMGDVALPGAPHWLTKRPVSGKILGKVAASHQESVRLLRESGVKLVMGSDAPGWPVILNGVHGYSSIREMELLEAIGMTPLEALDAATTRATEMLGVQDRGRIEVGTRADLVVHRQDPRSSTSAWRELSLVVLGGEARTPAEWLAD